MAKFKKVNANIIALGAPSCFKRGGATNEDKNGNPLYKIQITTSLPHPDDPKNKVVELWPLIFQIKVEEDISMNETTSFVLKRATLSFHVAFNKAGDEDCKWDPNDDDSKMFTAESDIITFGNIVATLEKEMADYVLKIRANTAKFGNTPREILPGAAGSTLAAEVVDTPDIVDNENSTEETTDK